MITRCRRVADNVLQISEGTNSVGIVCWDLGFCLSAVSCCMISKRYLKMKRKMIILTIIAAYLILLWDCKITYSNKKYVWKIEYKGLLWVGLDYWSIWRYESNDIPMKWLDWKRSAI